MNGSGSNRDNDSSIREVAGYFSLLLPLIAWLVTLVWVLPPVFGWSSLVALHSPMACESDRTGSRLRAVSYLVYLASGGFLLPFIPQIILSASFAKRKRRVTSNPDNNQRRIGTVSGAIVGGSDTDEGKKTASDIWRRDGITPGVMLILASSSVLAWLLYIVHGVTVVYDWIPPHWFSGVMSILPKLSTFWNPAIVLGKTFVFPNRCHCLISARRRFVSCPILRTSDVIPA